MNRICVPFGILESRLVIQHAATPQRSLHNIDRNSAHCLKKPRDRSRGPFIKRPLWDQNVVAETAIKDVDAPIANQYIVAQTAEERIISRSADKHIIVCSSVCCEQNRTGILTGRLHHVVAGQGVDH